ncbi:MAG: VanZ family protein [Patescibacteria group bacterium]
MKKKHFFKIFVFYYFPAFVWMGIIFYLSSIPGLKTGAAVHWEIIFRKIAHLTEYAILAFLFWRIFYYHLKIKNVVSYSVSFFLALIYAAGDETHQFFVKDRSGRWEDVVLDSIGVLLGLILVYGARKLFANKS